MNIIVPVIAPRLNIEYMNIQIGEETISIRNEKNKVPTIHALVRKLAGKGEFVGSKVIHRVNTTIGEQISRTVKKIASATKYSEIVPVWFKYKIISSAIAINKEKYIPVKWVFHSTKQCKPFLIQQHREKYYRWAIVLAPMLFSDVNSLQLFWIGAQAFKNCQSKKPLSSVLDSKECINWPLSSKQTYFYNAFRFYLWNAPSLIDIVPDFNIEARGLDLIPWIALPNIYILKELMKRKRPDLLAMAILMLPKIFANPNL